MARLVRRSTRQARAARASTGQGSARARQRRTPLASNKSPARGNISPLCSDSHTSCGRADTTLATTAPAPSATKSAGNTQHTSVAPLASKAPKATPTLRACASRCLPVGGQEFLAYLGHRALRARDGLEVVTRIGDGLPEIGIRDVRAFTCLYHDQLALQAHHHVGRGGNLAQVGLDALCAEAAHHAVNLHLDGVGASGQAGQEKGRCDEQYVFHAGSLWLKAEHG